jgi:hypothetical protein
MGSFAPQVQFPQSPQTGKGVGISPIPQQSGQQNEMNDILAGLKGLAGGRVTMPSQGGQPEMGMPNAYENTVQPYNPQQPKPSTGKGSPANNQFAQNAIGKGV